jgi:hypothetical protein
MDAGAPTDIAVQGYVTKPIDFEGLFARMAELTEPGSAT